MELHSIGSVLKNKRESSGLSLEEVFIHLKINIPNLKALEDNNYTLLPEPPFTRVFIKSYADYLGLDGAALARRYEESVLQKALDVELDKKDYLRYSFKTGSVIVSLLVFFLIIMVFVFWCRENRVDTPISRVDSIQVSNNLPDFDYQQQQQDSIRNDSLRADSLVAEDSVLAFSVTDSSTVVYPSIDSHSVTMVCFDTVWIKAVIDSISTIERYFQKTGTTTRYRYRFRKSLALHIGNAAGAYMIIDDRDTLKDLGPHGQSLHFLIDSLYLQKIRKK